MYSIYDHTTAFGRESYGYIFGIITTHWPDNSHDGAKSMPINLLGPATIYEYVFSFGSTWNFIDPLYAWLRTYHSITGTGSQMRRTGLTPSLRPHSEAQAGASLSLLP
jgi:hypothetical protein